MMLDNLDRDQLKSILLSICSHDPLVDHNVQQLCPKPSPPNFKASLRSLAERFQAMFPYGVDVCSEYAYSRVRQSYMDLLNGLSDYVSACLQPNDVSPMDALDFLDFATHIVHRVPDFQAHSDACAKAECYHDLSDAWCLVLQDAGRRIGGLGLMSGGWLETLTTHDTLAHGQLANAVRLIMNETQWVSSSSAGAIATPPRSYDVEQRHPYQHGDGYGNVGIASSASGLGFGFGM